MSAAMDENDFKRLLEANAQEMRRHFDVTAEWLEKRFDLLAETVEHIDKKIDRVEANLRDDMRPGFAEMIMSAPH